MIQSILFAIDINLTNLTDQLARHAIESYTNIIGNFFWGIFFGFMGVALYVAGEGDKRIYLTIAAYLVAVGIIFGIILDNAIIAIFGLVLVFLVSTILYKVFVETR